MVCRSFAMFIDLHCHLLHGIDDGPADLSGAVAIARLLSSLGFKTVVATPHALPEYADAGEASERRAELVEVLARASVALKLLEGAENRLDENFLRAEAEGRGRHLAGTSCALVETPYESVVPALPDLLFRMQRKGTRLVFAHPERCAQFQELRRAEEMARLGALFQLDLGSLAGAYGGPAKRTARKLLEAGLYSIAASDLHDAAAGEKWLCAGMKELERRVGKAGIERLLAQNPARLLREEELS